MPTLYNLSDWQLNTFYVHTDLGGGVVNAIDEALINSGNFPVGWRRLHAEVNQTVGTPHHPGLDTISVSSSLGLFVELGSYVHDTIVQDPTLVSSAKTHGHVIVAGDGDRVSVDDKNFGSDTLIAGYQDSLAVHQTLTASHGNDMLIGGLRYNAWDVLKAGSGKDTLDVNRGHNHLFTGKGSDTFNAVGGFNVMDLGKARTKDVVNSSFGFETISVHGGADTVNSDFASSTQVYLNNKGAVSITHGKKYDRYTYRNESGAHTTVEITANHATVHFTGGGSHIS